MRGYHIRIILQPRTEISTSQPHLSDNFTPTSLFQHLPAQQPKPTARRNALFNHRHKDYRFGPIRLDWIDFEDMSANKNKNQNTYATASSGKEKERGRGAFIQLLYTPCIYL